MSSSYDYEHEQRVQDFLSECKEERPEEYADVCERYPVQTSIRKSAVRRREITVGLLGLSASRVSLGTATRHDLDSIYSDSNDQ